MIRSVCTVLIFLLLVAVCPAQEPSVSDDNMAYIPGGEINISVDEGIIHFRLSPFYMDRTEVTVGDFKRCINKGVCRSYRKTTTPNLDSPELPMVDISPYDAQTYCKWVGKRLPTEAEWKIAARGKNTTQLFPWGSESPYGRANYVSTGVFRKDGNFYRFSNPPCTHPLGNTRKGICDMAGNIAEWVVGPPPPESSSDPESFVIVGGSYLSEEKELRIAWRKPNQHGLARYLYVGFRCVKDPS